MPKPKQTNWKIFFVQQWLHYLFKVIQYIMSGKVETSMLLLISIITRKIFLFACDWSKCVIWQDIPQPKVGNIWECSPIFKTVHVAKKRLEDKHNSFHLTLKIYRYVRIFVLGHHLFLKAHIFPWAKLLENCSPPRTNNIRWQISKHIFVPNGGYCLYI